MGSVQNFYTSRDNNTDPATYVGQLDRLWYNPVTNSIFVSDGVTPGGQPVALATGANIVANNITLNSITSTSGTVNVVGNLAISGNISPASNVKIGGISAGPGVVISNQGVLTIDTANLPLSFGNFTASNNVLSIVNVDEDMILQTEGDAEIQLIGNIGFYKPDGIPPDVGNRYFFASNDGQITIYVPEADPISGAVKIVGTSSGNTVPPAIAGVMLQSTGQNGLIASIYSDGVANNSAFVGRRYNGTATSPSQVLSGEVILRVTAVGYNSSGFQTSGSGTLSFDALENFTSTAQGTELKIYTTAIGSNTRSVVARVNNANGVSATKFTTTGTVDATGNIQAGNLLTGGVISAAGNITSGNLILSTGGLISSTGLISTTGNISAGNLAISGAISATANVTGGNILTTGLVSVTGNITAGNVNSYITLPAGTTSKAPLVFTAGTIPATPITGAMNYDGRIFYGVPQDSERGLIRTAQTYVLNTDYTLTDQSTVQSMFGVSTSVSTNTRYVYTINAVIYKSSNNITMSYAMDGNAVVARHTYQTITTAGATLATLSTPSVLKNILTNSYTTPVVVTAALNGAGYYSLTVTGIVNITTGGTWNPLIAFSGLPGAGSYVAAGSSIDIYPVGVGNATISIGNWA